MYKKLLTSAISLFICSQAMAQDYRVEGRLNYVNSQDTNYWGDEDADAINAAATYYFSPVKTQGHPLAEAAFLERNSSLSLSYLNSKADSSYQADYDTDHVRESTETKTTQAVLNAEAYLLNDFLYLGGSVVDTASKETYWSSYTSESYPEANSTRSGSDKDSDNQLRINLGIAPTEGLLVWTEVDEDSSRNSSFNLNAKYVMEFNGSALNLQGGLGRNTFTQILAAAAYSNAIKINFSSVDAHLNSSYILSDYYFNNRFSLGLGASHINSKYGIDDVYMIRSQLFFSDSISGQVAYLQDESEYSAFNLGVSLRF